jgi:hypothetical protein
VGPPAVNRAPFFFPRSVYHFREQRANVKRKGPGAFIVAGSPTSTLPASPRRMAALQLFTRADENQAL